MVTPEEAQFLAQSAELREREAAALRRQRAFLATILLLLVVALGATVGALGLWQRAEEATETAAGERDKANEEKQKAEQATGTSILANLNAAAKVLEAQLQRVVALEEKQKAEGATAVAKGALAAAEQEKQKAEEATQVAEGALAVAEQEKQKAESAKQEALQQAENARAATKLASVRELLATGRPTPAMLLLGELSQSVRDYWELLQQARVAPGRLEAVLGHTGPVRTAVWSPDGSRVLTASEDNTARVWTAAGAPVATLTGHAANVWSAVWSPDGSRVLTASEDNTARVWTAAGAPVATLIGHTGWVSSAVWSPDGSRVLTVGDNTPRVWTAAGAPVATLTGHTRGVQSAEWSADGSRVLTASFDDTARVWTAAGEPVGTLIGHTDTVWSAVWSPDGSRVLTASSDGTARIWPEELWRPAPPLCLSPSKLELYMAETEEEALRNYAYIERSHGREPLETPPDL